METPLPDGLLDSLDPGWFARMRVKLLNTSQSILADRPTLGKRYPTLLKLAFSLGVLAWVLSRFDLAAIARHLREAPWSAVRCPESTAFGPARSPADCHAPTQLPIPQRRSPPLGGSRTHSSPAADAAADGSTAAVPQASRVGLLGQAGMPALPGSTRSGQR